MDEIEEFLTHRFLQCREGLTEPDGRLLYLYECADHEFWTLVDVLKSSGPPEGHDFEEYRREWRELRQRLGPVSPRRSPYQWMTDIDWKARAFVLYASEFWRRFKNEEWRRRTFPDPLPFKKLTWLQFLSLVDWTDLYDRKVVGYITVADSEHHVAHGSDRYSGDERLTRRMRKRRRPSNAGNYPGLYFPMLSAWEWWKVAPVRLPSSIRYLDTFAYHGGADDRLILECERAFQSGTKLAYRPTRPPSGYGIDFIALDEESIPPNADKDTLNVTLVFGAPEASLKV